MRSLSVAGVVAITAVVVSVCPAAADPIRVDQSVFEPGSHTGAVIGLTRSDTTCCDLATQVFTAGVTAPLVAVSVVIEATQITPLSLMITPTLDTADPYGLPDLSHILAQISVASGSATANDILFLPRAIGQVEGHRYAIVASYPNAPPPPSPFAWEGSWLGTTRDAYLGGEPISHRRDGSWIRQLGTDLQFATYVVTPEPGTLLLLASGLGCMLARRRGRLTR